MVYCPILRHPQIDQDTDAAHANCQVATNFAKLLMLDAECVHPYELQMQIMDNYGSSGVSEKASLYSQVAILFGK